MEIKPIKTEADYGSALKEIERLMEADFEPDTPEGDRLEVFVTLVEAYEAKHYPMGLPDPIEAIKIRMEDLELARKDLEPLIGTGCDRPLPRFLCCQSLILRAFGRFLWNDGHRFGCQVPQVDLFPDATQLDHS